MKSHIIQVSAYYPPHVGGQENAVHDLASQLARSRHAVDVLASAQGAAKGRTREKGVQVRRLPSFVFGHAPIMPQFAAALWQTATPSSIIHLHIGQAFTPEMVWLVSTLRQTPYIAQLHVDFEPAGPAGFLLPLYKRLVLKPVLQAAAAVIVLNQQMFKIVRNTYGRHNGVHLIPNGISEVYFELKRQPLKPVPPKQLRLLFVGRLAKQKNLTSLLKALSMSKRPLTLDVVGDGEERQVVEQLITQLGLTNVRMHGRLARDQILNFYKTCDALVMPSLYEAQPLVLLEALAARIPIIGTDVIGVAEHLKGAGIIVPPTPEGLVSGIERYYQQYAGLASMVQHGHRLADRSRWRHLLNEYERLYDAVSPY